MMHKTLQQQLQEKTNLPWQVGVRHGSQHMDYIKWFPVVAMARLGFQLGLSDAGLWVRASSKSVSEFKPNSPHVFMLPLLEMKVEEITQLLTEGFRNVDLAKEIVTTFPFEDIVTTGLTSQSENWTRLALSWVGQIAITPKIIDALQNAAENGPTQTLRHAATQLLRSKGRLKIDL